MDKATPTLESRPQPTDDNAQRALALLVPTLCTNVNGLTKFWNLYYIGTNQEMSYEMAEKLYKQGKDKIGDPNKTSECFGPGLSAWLSSFRLMTSGCGQMLLRFSKKP